MDVPQRQEISGRGLLLPAYSLLLLWLWGPQWWCDCGEIRSVPSLPSINFSRPGNFNIGIVMSIHRSQHFFCDGGISALGALHRLESMVFAVEEINNRDDILPGITLGFTVLDDCSSEVGAMGRALHFIQNPTNHSSVSTDTLPAVCADAVIGTEGSSGSMSLAGVFSLFHLPQLSYSASSPLLDNQRTFPYFSRLVPSDSMQARAIVDLIHNFGWTFVSIVYSKGSYSTEGFRAIAAELESKGYCHGVTLRLRSSFKEKDYKNVIHRLLASPRAQVVVIFTYQDQALKLFQTLDNMGLNETITWIAGDSVITDPHAFKDVGRIVRGTLSVSFHSSPVQRFDDSFRRMTLRKGSRNPWFGEFISAAFGCSLGDNASDVCDEDKEIGETLSYKADPTVALAMNSVYAFGHALHNITMECPEKDDIHACVTPQVLRDRLRMVNFEGEGMRVSFDTAGNGLLSYDIRNIIVREDGSVEHNVVGIWSTKFQHISYLHKDQIQWKPGSKMNVYGHPESVCSQPCLKGQQAIVTQPHCCFYCENCRQYQRTVMYQNLPKCQTCPTKSNFTWPDDETRTECHPLQPSFLGFRDTEGIVITVFDMSILILTCVIAYFYKKNGQTRLIKASSQELCTIMLVGHVLTCLLVLTFFLEPYIVTCIIIDTGFHLSFTFTYAPLLVRVNRIFRIFRKGTSTTKKPANISPRAQVFFTLVIIAIQITLTSITVALDPPKVRIVMPNLMERHLKKECSVPEVTFIVSITFNIILMALCAVHALKTQNLPDNFNETKFITFSVYTTVLLWLSFFPTYFTANNYKVEAICLAVALLFNVLSNHMFHFLPKLYAIYFISEEEMHVRGLTRSCTRTGTY